jgi:hypothetical protein
MYVISLAQSIRMYEEHPKSCSYCQNSDRITKLTELGHMIKGTKAASSSSSSVTTTKSYLNPKTNTNDQLKKAKLIELGKMVSGF